MNMRIEPKTVICTIIVLLGIGCGKAEADPKDVLSKYLNALRDGRFEEAYQYICAKDKAVRGLEEYVSEQSEGQSLLGKGFSSMISCEIKKPTITGDKAKANVDFTRPNLMALIFKDLWRAVSMSILGEKKDEKEIAKILAEKLKGEDLPMLTSTRSFDLVKETDGWKVFFDWKSEQVKAEKEARIKDLLAEAKKLKRAKKLPGVLKKYEEVLELDSKMAEAKEGVRETEKAIQELKEKQEYIKSVELYDLSARYHKTYLDDKVPGVKFKLRNKRNRTLKEVEVTVYFKDSLGTIISEEDYHPVLVTSFSSSSDKLLKPNYIWQMERGHFYQARSVPSEWKEGAVSAKITNIEFANEKEEISLSANWIKAKTANVRSGPSTHNSIISTLRKGDKVYLINQQGKWSKVRFGKRKENVGWIHSSLLSKSEKTLDKPKGDIATLHKIAKDIQLYQMEIESAIKSNWSYPVALLNLKREKIPEAVILVTVRSDGKILKTLFKRRSHNALFDDSVLEAIEKSDPLPGFPPDYGKSHEEVEINFNLKDLL